MNEKILNLLNSHLLEVEHYDVLEKKLAELQKQRILKDIEEYGITSSFFHYERLFILKNNKVVEKNIQRQKTRLKEYGQDEKIEEEGKPLENYIDGTEDAIIIASSMIDTKPKGPHTFKKELEIYCK
ncbi:MAG: hypothetical protein A2Y62_11775 [Candidatus Fischerbacteria bacterium RBG_13_37_8]|uniref:Uncharacterized protein n=1 Tax=Candidatus Fischerbacteria bacterium RBG_13_37_8 TaxID=1817863 RepID=A0A1F5VGM2_9BACT|nr:MAG: hypothetical protein A2Y62_11775 [Candidatus Fischerbacteria bacterium RBG_13_37_8]